jgi:FtsH-binding integral membrane protein
MAIAIQNRISLLQIRTINQSFTWMCIGLIITALSSLFIASSSTLVAAVNSNSFVFFGLIVAELIIVAILSFKIRSMTFEEAIASFLIYSFLNGLTLSSIFLIYTGTSIVSTFFITAVVFGVMALYGYTTKRDLTTIGNLAIMALIGIIISSFVNLFLQNSAFSYILSYLSIAIFIGLTAYDTQKIKAMGTDADNQNLGILGALTLYLDFINIFINLLRILGNRRDD